MSLTTKLAGSDVTASAFSQTVTSLQVDAAGVVVDAVSVSRKGGSTN